MSLYNKLINKNFISSKTLDNIKALLAALVFLSLIYFLLEGVSRYAINWNKYKSSIITELKDALGDVEIRISNLDGSLLLPKITAYNIYIHNKDNLNNEVIVIPKAETKISLLKLLLFKLRITGIDIESIDINPNDIKVLSSSMQHSKKSIGSVRVKKGKLKLRSNIFQDVDFEELNLTTAKKRLHITSNVMLDNHQNKLLLDSNNGTHDFSITSDSIALKFHGENNQGTIDVKGESLTNTLNNIFKPLSFRKKLWHSFTIQGKASWSSDGFKIDNITLTDKNALINMNMMYQPKNNNSYINLIIRAMNLDQLLSNEKFNNLSISDILKPLEGNRGELYIKDLSIEAYDIVYNKNTIESINIHAIHDDEQLKIKKLQFNLPGETFGEVSGHFVNNDIISKFDGDISVTSKDAKKLLEWLLPIKKKSLTSSLQLTSKLSFAPQSLLLDNVNITLDDASITSKIFFRNNTRDKKVKAQIKVNNLNIDDYTLNNNSSDSSNINKLIYGLDVQLSAHNITYQNSKLTEVSGKLLASNGKLLLQDMLVHSDDVQGIANITLFNKGVDKQIIANLDIDYLNTTTFPTPNILTIDQNPNKPEVQWLAQPISWLGIENYNGTISGVIKKLDTKLLSFNNITTNLELKNKLLSISKLESHIGNDTTLSLIGNIGMESDSSMLLSFNVTNLAFPIITSNVFDVTKFIDGKISAVGSLKSKGNSIAEIVNNISGKMELAARQITVEGFDIDTLITRLIEVKSNANLATLTKVLLYTNQTNFKNFDGVVNLENGIAGTTLQFKTDATSGVLSSHLTLQDFNTNSATRFFFLNPTDETQILSIDMDIQGPLWLPKFSFDNNAIYEMITTQLQTTETD